MFEPSFSITPDPRYLFLSEQHREALAHLLYGASETGGFVLLTGEVGTGKTTVCRAFLEQLPDGVEVGLVLNPALTGLELIAAVCDEFGVQVPPHERSTKRLIDLLNTYLLECHAKGRRPVLIIDEAQNLRPAVLEQVRLLTNLETPKHKLLQIFLVGQPELRTLLASEELRQLNQRITARFHLSPLSKAETGAYIRHRLAIAGVDRPLFSRAAVRHVHRHSGGVPRLINLICDRALLGTAVSHRLQANATIVDQAAREVRGRDLSQPWPQRPAWLGMALTAVLAAAVGIWIGGSGLLPWPATQTPASAAQSPVEEGGDAHTARMADNPSDQSPTSAPSGKPAPGSQTSAAAAATSTQDAMPDQQALIETTEATGQIAAVRAQSVGYPTLLPVTPEVIATPHGESASLGALLHNPQATLETLLRLWDQPWPTHAEAEAETGTELKCATLEDQVGLACEHDNGRWSNLRRFDRPAALQLTLADGRQGEVVLRGLNEEYALIDAGEGRAPLAVLIADLDQRWSGDYRLLWRLPPTGERVIGRTATPASIRWLRAQLRAWPAGDPLLPDGDAYDQTLMTQVRAFQSEQGLEVDGIAGPQTLILLANVLTPSSPEQP
nr:ExeA family protein [Rhabdochromatium marinum]